VQGCAHDGVAKKIRIAYPCACARGKEKKIAPMAGTRSIEPSMLELERFTLKKIEAVYEAGREKLLGSGAHNVVLEFKFNGLKCAGKKIHDWLLKDEVILHRFEEECHLLSRARHPNIVQFLGVYFQQGVRAPILVMEFLPTNLTTSIEQYGIFPKEISYSILHDVALGLCYLHSQTPPIIHRVLSSNNILLTPNMTAKISDLGTATIHGDFDVMTSCPGTPVFMPPKVMINTDRHDTCIDEFSYGIMMIHIFSGRWPVPQDNPIFTEGGGANMIIVSEAKRRDVFLRAIGNDHPLMDLILQCIDQDPLKRPCAREMVERLARMVFQFPTYANQLEMMRRIEATEIQMQRSQDKEYIAQLFYLNQTTSTCEIHLVVTWNVEAHLTVSDSCTW
jgi:serine/threonine protein kinase